MTLQELKHEIEHGPMAAKLRPYWNDVFEPQEKPEPDAATEPEKHAAWLAATKVKKTRAGRLKPDAAFEIARLLKLPSVDLKTVQAAKGA